MAWYTSIYDTLEDIKQKIIDEYMAKGLKASGDFERNIKIGRQGRYKVVLTLPYYSEFISKFKSNEGGRRPTGPEGTPPQAVIEKWIRDKGLSLRDLSTGRFRKRTQTSIKQAAFLIKRKIQVEGTDIYLKKREPIDLDQITDNVFDYKMEEIADRILQELNI